MNVGQLSSLLAGLPIPQVRYSEVIGSTNDAALHWTNEGAVDGCLVAADQQTQGRGRFGRAWVTRPGSALAFSLILRPTRAEQEAIVLFSPLAALAICQALEETLGLAPEIKWPNDVLLGRRKTAGILVEAAWQAERAQGLVIGIGVNVTAGSAPPDGELLFPATSAEAAAGRPVDRWKLLRAILSALFAWRSRVATADFHQAWEQRLAFKGERVRIEEGGRATDDPALAGLVRGVDRDGSLILSTDAGENILVRAGDVHLRKA
jgi:BirA family biotin operon repressor/biotin-[acetyl-CoA-carboxylase] ligase